jgi:DNA-binding transcriptional ArsR family regulator
MTKPRNKNASNSQAETTTRMIKAVADPDRLKIVQSLRSGAKNVGELAKLLGAHIVNVSHHLSVLRGTKVVASHKKGRFVYYTLHPETFRAGDGGRSDTLTLGMCKLEMGR